jgi:hypothetical protein
MVMSFREFGDVEHRAQQREVRRRVLLARPGQLFGGRAQQGDERGVFRTQDADG